jgi:predicted DNA-binding transcriptional regulator YafY
MKEKSGKYNRTLDIYVRLCEGKIINKAEEALKYQVNERSIQRDIDDIRAFLAENKNRENDVRTIRYDHLKKGYVMEGGKTPLMTNSEILAVSKILLESRAFTRKDMNQLLDKLISGCVPLQNMKLVTDLIANERYHYVELKHSEENNEKMWDLGVAVKNSLLIEIKYKRQVDIDHISTRYVEPVAITFSEYYFYLIGYLVKLDEDGQPGERKFDYPAVFRIDRIQDYKILEQHFSIPYNSRFEDGEFRKRVQFMYPGKLTNIQIKYTGKAVEAVLDRLPTAQLIRQEEGAYYIQAEVYGRGILMWLLSQGEYVEVLKPESLREKMKEKLLKILELYQE